MTKSADLVVLIVWIYTVCKGMAYLGSAGPGTIVLEELLLFLVIFLSAVHHEGYGCVQ